MTTEQAPGAPNFNSRAIDKVLAHADCQSAIQAIDNRRYSVAQTGSLLYRRLLTGLGCETTCANFLNGPVARRRGRILLIETGTKRRQSFAVKPRDLCPAIVHGR